MELSGKVEKGHCYTVTGWGVVPKYRQINHISNSEWGPIIGTFHGVKSDLWSLRLRQ